MNCGFLKKKKKSPSHPIHVTSLMHTATPLTQYLQSLTAIDLPLRQTQAKLERLYGFMLTSRVAI